jgi:16S rRNA (cytidine1402-2'-O)-methyltransferase
LRLTLAEAVAYYEENAPRGEYVLVVEGAGEGSTPTETFWVDMTVPDHVAYYVGQGMTKKDAIKAAAKDRGVPKNEVYQQVLD